VAHHWNFGFGKARDELEAALATFDFHGFDAGFLYEADGVAQGFGGLGVVAAEGHVGDEESVLGAATYSPRVMDHLVERDRQGAVVT
jgi:hypothetical protein